MNGIPTHHWHQVPTDTVSEILNVGPARGLDEDEGTASGTSRSQAPDAEEGQESHRPFPVLVPPSAHLHPAGFGSGDRLPQGLGGRVIFGIALVPKRIGLRVWISLTALSSRSFSAMR